MRVGAFAVCISACTAVVPPRAPRSVGRRAILSTAASFSLIRPALADGDAEAALYDLDLKNVGGYTDYTPSMVVANGGSSSAKVDLKVPPGPIADKDFIDVLWFRNAQTKKVVAAQDFKRSNQIISGKTPALSARVPKGVTLVPVMHCEKAGTWEGAPVSIK